MLTEEQKAKAVPIDIPRNSTPVQVSAGDAMHFLQQVANSVKVYGVEKTADMLSPVGLEAVQKVMGCSDPIQAIQRIHEMIYPNRRPRQLSKPPTRKRKEEKKARKMQRRRAK